MRMYCWNPKNQPNKMRMTPQHIHTIPTSCAISPTIPPCFIFSRFCSTEMNSVQEIIFHKQRPPRLSCHLKVYIRYVCELCRFVLWKWARGLAASLGNLLLHHFCCKKLIVFKDGAATSHVRRESVFCGYQRDFLVNWLLPFYLTVKCGKMILPPLKRSMRMRY